MTIDPRDVAHTPGSEENWQESVVLFFGDRTSGTAGYIRIGTEPNRGLCQYWLYLQAPDGHFYRDMRLDQLLTDASRRSDGFAAGALRWRHLGNGVITVKADLPDAAIDLRYTDYYPATPCWKWIGSVDIDIGAASHFEASGSVEGTIRIGDQHLTISDGMGHRDHSWGARDGSRLRTCRWFVGTVGPQLSYSVITFLDTDGHLAIGGWATRHGVTEHARSVDIVAHTNIDGVTIRGGQLRMDLEGGDRIDLRHDSLINFITAHNSDHGGPASYVGSESVSRSYHGDDAGIGCLTTVNCVSGTGLPLAAICEDYSTLTNGLGKLDDHEPTLIDLRREPAYA